MKSLPSLLMAATLCLVPPIFAQQTFNLGATRSTYRVGPGEVLRLGIFYSPSYDDSLKVSGDYPVLPDGTLTVPLVGTLNVTGLEVGEIESLLSQRYSAYFKKAVISVSILNLRPVRVVLTGEVNRPGPVELKPGATLTSLLQTAGGVTEAADVRNVTFIPAGGQVRTLNLWNLITADGQGRDLLLADGDRIFIPKGDGSEDTTLLTRSTFGQGKMVIPVVGDVSTYVALDATTPYAPLVLAQAGIPAKEVRDYDIQVAHLDANGEATRRTIDLSANNLAPDTALRSGDVLVVTRRGKPFLESLWTGLQTVVLPARDLLTTLLLFRNFP